MLPRDFFRYIISDNRKIIQKSMAAASGSVVVLLNTEQAGSDAQSSLHSKATVLTDI